MALVLVYVGLVLGSAAALTEASLSQLCGRYYDVNPGFHSDATFTLLPLNDIMLTQNMLCEVSSRSKMDCGHQCVGAEGCVMFTFRRSQQGASGRCQVYGQVYNATQDHEVSPGARSYVLHYQAFKRLYNGYSMRSGRCIQVITEILSYHNAIQRCGQLDGGHLLFTKTAQDVSFGHSIVQEYGFSRVWVGANDLEKEGEFQWADGTPLPNDSPLWASGEPDIIYGTQRCVCVWPVEGKIHNCHCAHGESSPSLTVCQRDV